jgi:hypothetical protein
MSEWDEVHEYDWSGIQERLAFLLYQMATKVIGDQIKVDPLAADNAIRYCRERIAGGPYHPARQERFWDFVERCGGNFDWVMSGDVTSLIINYGVRLIKQPARVPSSGARALFCGGHNGKKNQKIIEKKSDGITAR